MSWLPTPNPTYGPLASIRAAAGNARSWWNPAGRAVGQAAQNRHWWSPAAGTVARYGQGYSPFTQPVPNAAPMAQPSGGGGGAPMAPAGPDYASQFANSLSAARANIRAQLEAALAETGRQEGVAQGMVGELPGQFSQLHSQADSQVADIAASADAAQKNQGLQSYSPASGQIAPLQGAMQQAYAFQQAGVPLLHQGTQELYARQRGGLEQARMAQEGALSEREAQFAAQMAQGQQSAQNALALAAAQHGYSAEDRAAEEAFQRQMGETNFGNQQALAEQARAGNLDAQRQLAEQAHGYDVQSQQVQTTQDQMAQEQKLLDAAGVTMTAAEAETARVSPQYRYYVARMTNAYGLGSEGGAAIMKELEDKNPKLAALLKFDGYGESKPQPWAAQGGGSNALARAGRGAVAGGAVFPYAGPVGPLLGGLVSAFG